MDRNCQFPDYRKGHIGFRFKVFRRMYWSSYWYPKMENVAIFMGGRKKFFLAECTSFVLGSTYGIMLIKHWNQRPTFSSLIFSCKSTFDSLSLSASLRSCIIIRIASLRTDVLSVFGGLPGSKIDPNSKNLRYDFQI